MNIYAKHGDKVVAVHLDNGWDSDREKAEKYLEQDKEYTVDYTIVYSSSTEVFLVEIPDIAFNSVHFDDVANNILEAIYGTSKPIYRYECCNCKKENLVNTPYEDILHCSFCSKVNTFDFDIEMIL